MSDLYINYVANNISEFIEIINDINKMKKYNNRELWYRGQSNSSWRLEPAIIREMVPYSNQFGERISSPSISSGDIYLGPDVNAMLEEFKRKSYPFLTNEPNNEFEWMFVAQHHGLPTRLLDWTINPLVALYFALENESFKKKNFRKEDLCEDEFNESDELRSDGVAIFVMDPVEINTLFHPELNQVVDITANPEKWKKYSENSDERGYAPICVRGNFKNDRIRFQSGNFTLHGSNIWSLDYYTITNQKFHKIFIQNSKVFELKQELSRLGINKSFIYPGLDSLADDIKNNEFERFTKGIQ